MASNPSNSQTNSQNSEATTSSDSSISDQISDSISPFSNSSTILDSEHTLINDDEHELRRNQLENSYPTIRRPQPQLPEFSLVPPPRDNSQPQSHDSLPSQSHINLPSQSHHSLLSQSHNNLLSQSHNNLPSLSHNNLPSLSLNNLPSLSLNNLPSQSLDNLPSQSHDNSQPRLPDFTLVSQPCDQSQSLENSQPRLPDFNLVPQSCDSSQPRLQDFNLAPPLCGILLSNGNSQPHCSSQMPGKSSGGSSLLDELPSCDEHRMFKEFFCFDCIYEVCVNCIKRQHREHYLYPGMTCRELFDETEKAKAIVRENIAVVEKQLHNLYYRKQATANHVKAWFQRVREIINNREMELLHEVAVIADCRTKCLEQKLAENQEANNESNKIMEHLMQNLHNGDYEYVVANSRFAKKQLEVLRRLQKTVQNQDEDVMFCPPDDALMMRLKDMGMIVCPSYIASFGCNNIRGGGATAAVHNAAAVTTVASTMATAAATAAAMFNNRPGAVFNHNHNLLFDNSPQYNPFQTFGPPQLPRSPISRVIPPIPPSLNGAAAAITAVVSESSNFPMLPFMGNPLRNDTVPMLSPLGTSLAVDHTVPAAAAMNMFPVSFHTRRNYARIKKPVTVFGKEGSGDYDLCRPWGVCCDNNGHVIVADRSNNRIQIFRSDGSHVRNFGHQGCEEGEFNRPAGVAIDYYGRIVVTDKDNHRIQVFTMEGKFLFTFGERGQANGKFHYPWDVDVNATGLIAVSDTRNHRVQLFTGNGMFVKKFGFENMSNMWKFFDSPRGLCFTPENTIMVTDFNNHRLYEIDIEKTPKLLHAETFKKCELFRPQGLAMDGDGNILVSDCRNNRIQVFSRRGDLIGSFGVAGKELGQFDRPSGIALTPDGKIVVVDFGNHRIQIF